MNDVIIYLHNFKIATIGLTVPWRGPISEVQTSDLNEFKTSTASRKIAIVEYEYCDPAFTPRPTIALLESLAFADLVIFKTIEGNFVSEDIIQKLDRPNFVFFIGHVPSVQPKHAKLFYDLYWLKSTASLYLTQYKEFDFREQFDALVAKDIPFEVLYGTEKLHRSFVKKYIKSNPHFLESKFLELSSVHSESYGDADDIFWEAGIAECPGNTNRVIFNGKEMVPSQVLPMKVYNKTAYSIVCETDFDNTFTFPTEKIAKPMIAGRLFIVISGQHYLRDMRSLGFKTFDGIIDESYDEIEDNHLRWIAALKEAMKLCEQNQFDVLKKCGAIFAHNQEQLIKMQLPYFQVERYLEEFISQNLDDALK